MSLLCPVQVPSPRPFTGESMARSLSQPDAMAVSEGSRQRSRFPGGKREEVCAARGFFLLSRLRISDSIARSRSRSSFPQSTYNLLRIGMMSLPSRGCWGVWKGGVTTSGSRHSRWINEVQGGSRSEDDARLCRQADPSSHAVLPFAEWDFQWLQGRVCCSLLSL